VCLVTFLLKSTIIKRTLA